NKVGSDKSNTTGSWSIFFAYCLYQIGTSCVEILFDRYFTYFWGLRAFYVGVGARARCYRIGDIPRNRIDNHPVFVIFLCGLLDHVLCMETLSGIGPVPSVASPLTPSSFM